MPLAAGARLGPYEIIAPIGVGGMGEVYRARDTTLNRDVALKVLPEAVTLDPDRLARFKREAQVLAVLNHPHITAIYGFEASDGVQALVLELVEGQTLADRIARGPMPIDEVLPIARQIAEALEGAHEQGIMHRDLKPANIKLRPDGTVKVLDFGLAKVFESGPVASDLSNSPTITSPAVTRMGVILGTAAYMSPEQAKGRAIDKRSDIWAFGCVLYEMLAGARAFDGEDVSETLAAVLRAEPDLAALPRETPASIRRLLRRALEKDRRNRLPDMAVRGWILTTRRGNRARWPAHPRPSHGAAKRVGGRGRGAFADLRRESGQDEVVIQSFPEPGLKQQVSTAGGAQPCWSRDGKELFYLAPNGMLMSVAVTSGRSALELSASRPLFQARLPNAAGGTSGKKYDVSADGHFLMSVATNRPGEPSTPLTVVLNWFTPFRK